MARAIWTGVITFGLVTVPVGLFTATEDHTVHFHQLQRGTGDRVRNRRVNERTGEEVSPADIVKGYEVGEGEYVIVEPDELEEIAPGRSKTIEISDFVDLDRIEPVYFARTYYVAPRGEEYLKVYELLRAALERTGKAGVATFVMRNKQYLTALRAEDRLLVLQTLHWADEVRDPGRELPELPSRRAGSGKELDMALRLVDALSGPWEPRRYRDTYQEKVRALVQAKAEGREVAVAEGPPEATGVVDLMAVLESSLARAGASGSGRSGSRQDSGRGASARSGSRRSGSAGKDSGRAGSRASRPERARPPKDRERGASRSELRQLSKAELYERAGEQGVVGRSRMTRDQLVDALARPGRRTAGSAA
ncbi:Ku protein [Streptomyces sp. NPDC003456]|uniref:non-homologous end joining protein Ku n=1 Tax=Streptomyces sp. NPDC003456 TaxID=3364683 RepID=UPI0036A2203D